VSLYRRQAIGDRARVHAQPKHRSGVARRLGLNDDLSDHRLSSGLPPSIHSILAVCHYAMTQGKHCKGVLVHVVSFVTQKGGSGKSTTAASIAVAASSKAAACSSSSSTARGR
jgi:hypothetical protein